jgi:predicted dehydrogenase
MGKKMQNIEHQIPVSLSSHNIEAEVNEFCDCIVADREPSIGAIEGAIAVAVCEAIIRSSETGEPEKIVY